MVILNNRSISSLLLLTQSVVKGHRSIFTSSIDYFRVTSHLWAEPLKKKKREDPHIAKAREDRKKKRIEKEIKRLEKNVLQFKPLEEMEVTSGLKNSLELRKRALSPLSEDEEDRRAKISREWSIYKCHQHKEDFTMINKALKAAESALKELRLESEELYQEAIQLDLQLHPFRCKGPVFSHPIEGFDPIDGDFKDVSKKWE